VLKELQKEIAHLDYSNTVIRFSIERPIPSGIVKKLVLARVQEIENQRKGKRKSL
jgi:uncharacterized protein YdhG (YjbR/CyaY superfamily)